MELYHLKSYTEHHLKSTDTHKAKLKNSFQSFKKQHATRKNDKPVKTPKKIFMYIPSSSPSSNNSDIISDNKLPSTLSVPQPKKKENLTTPTVPPATPKTHPLTFFHASQAKAVHRDWPSVNYNTIQIHRGSTKPKVKSG
jgi:hypothetical protein